MIIRSKEEKDKILAYANEFSVREAAEKFGVHQSSIFGWLKKNRPQGAKRVFARKTPSPTVISIPTEQEPETCAVIICNPKNLRSVLAGLGHG